MILLTQLALSAKVAGSGVRPIESGQPLACGYPCRERSAASAAAAGYASTANIPLYHCWHSTLCLVCTAPTLIMSPSAEKTTDDEHSIQMTTTTDFIHLRA